MLKIALKNVVWKEGKYFVSQCLNVDVASFGKTKKTALANLDEALELYFEEAKGVNYELLDLIEKLKKHYKVFLFTDTIDIHDEVNKDRGIYERFDGVIKSFEERLSKHSGKRHILTYSGNLI